LAELSEQQKDYAAALRYADKVLELDPRMIQMRILRIVSLMNTGAVDSARSQLSTLSREFPADREVRHLAAALEIHDKQYALAEQHLRALIQENPRDFRAQTALVQTLNAQGEFDKAVTFLNAERKLHSDSSELALLVAGTLLQAGRTDAAITEYQKVVAAAPSAQAYVGLGNVYRGKKDFTNAISAYEKAAGIAPQEIAPIILLSETLEASGQLKRALEVCREGLKRHPSDPMLLNSAAYLTAENAGNLDEALSLVQRALQIDSQQSAFSDTLGWIYFKKNLVDSAHRVFAVLTTKYPKNASYRYHYGLVLLKTGDRKAANSQFLAALASNPSSELRPQIQSLLSESRGSRDSKMIQ